MNVKKVGTKAILNSRYKNKRITPNIQGRDIEFQLKGYEFMRLEIVYRLLNLCNDTIMLASIFQLFPDVNKGTTRGYIKFLLDKKMIILEYHIVQGHKVPFYTTTSKGEELRNMMSMIYNILGI